jgi:hypothetical protein
MHQKRIIDIDILRTFIIVSALLLHFNNRFGIGFLAIPSMIVQYYIFTVGGFFFFIAGYMARKVYLERYFENPKFSSKRTFVKGIKIMSIYILYVFFMYIFTDTDIPKDIIVFLFKHKFYTTVLFTFGVLYSITPLFLFAAINHKRPSIIILIMLIIFVISYDSYWPLPYALKILILDRQLFRYPLFPSIVIYAVGFTIASIEINSTREIASLKMTLFVLMLICVHLFLSIKFQPYSKLIHNRQYFTLVESITPYLAIIAIRYLSSIDLIYKYLATPYVLCVGICSFHFYVISSLLLGLLSISKGSEPGIKLLGLIGICLLSYMVTFWRFRSIHEIKSLTLIRPSVVRGK